MHPVEAAGLSGSGRFASLQPLRLDGLPTLAGDHFDIKGRTFRTLRPFNCSCERTRFSGERLTFGNCEKIEIGIGSRLTTRPSSLRRASDPIPALFTLRDRVMAEQRDLEPFARMSALEFSFELLVANEPAKIAEKRGRRAKRKPAREATAELSPKGRQLELI